MLFRERLCWLNFSLMTNFHGGLVFDEVGWRQAVLCCDVCVCVLW